MYCCPSTLCPLTPLGLCAFFFFSFFFFVLCLEHCSLPLGTYLSFRLYCGIPLLLGASDLDEVVLLSVLLAPRHSHRNTHTPFYRTRRTVARNVH